MPDTRAHRGQHPKDAACFGPEALPSLRAAVHDLSWLLSREYSPKSALQIVGDRYGLTARQRVAVGRSACSDRSLAARSERLVAFEAAAGRPVAVDGYNQLITAEAALSGGILLRGRDGALRDLASVHSTYRRVTETVAALELLGERLASLTANTILWRLDRPVSNSGRLRELMLSVAEQNGWNWDVRLAWAPDKAVAVADVIAISSDSWVLDHCHQWLNLTAALLDALPNAVVVDLGAPASLPRRTTVRLVNRRRTG